jgi:hypothetical protein
MSSMIRTEQEIDELVYALYGLTGKEIKIAGRVMSP